MAPTQQTERPTKRRKIDFGEDSTVTVLVGSNKKKFVIHRDALTQSSSFFRSAMKPEWQESTERRVELPTQDAEIFSVYLNWLYGGFIDVWKEGEQMTKYTNEWSEELENAGSRYNQIINAYILGIYV